MGMISISFASLYHIIYKFIPFLRIFSEKASGWGNLRQDDSGTDLGLTVGRLIIACSIIAVNFPGKFDFLFSSLIDLLPFQKDVPMLWPGTG